MDDFEREALARLPLAESVWTLLRYVVSPEFAAELFDKHRGTGYEGDVRFGVLVELVSDAILQHGGSGRRSFQAARANGRLAATTRAVYGKLSRVPLELSQVFLSGATQRLQEVLPTTPTCVLPESLRRFSVVVVDGKKIKGLAKRVKVLRDFRGKALGGKGVVALHLNTQLAIAMEASPDGEANDAPLTPGVLEQVRALLPDELLYVKDRQFCDLTIPALVVEQGSHFLIRYSKKMGVFPEKSRICAIARGGGSWTSGAGRRRRRKAADVRAPRDTRTTGRRRGVGGHRLARRRRLPGPGLAGPVLAALDNRAHVSAGDGGLRSAALDRLHAARGFVPVCFVFAVV